MEKLHRKLKISNTTNSVYSFNIFLTEKYSLIGSTQSDTNSINSNEPSNNPQTITGQTDSRLEEVETFDRLSPFKVGINGVQSITYNNDGSFNEITYIIDNITYITRYFDLFTVFVYTTYGINGFNSDTFSLIKDDTLMGIDGQPQIDNNIFVERQEITVFDPHIRLKYINNVGELITYGGGLYYKIFN